MHENEKLKAQVTDLTGQVADLGNTVKDLHKENTVRKALTGKVADPDTVAGLLTPQLRDIEADKVAEHIAGEDFAPRLAAFKAAETPPAGDGGDGGDGSNEQSGGTTEPGAGGFGGPSPGNDNGSKPATGATDPIVVGTPEYKKLITDPDAYAAAVKANRVVDASPSY
jgi:hypothetical protein